MSTIFQTPRLLFRHLEPGDLDDLHRLYRDPEIRRYFPDGTRTREETLEELEFYLDGHPRDRRLGLWACVDRGTGAFVGRAGLLRWEIDGMVEIEIAYMVAKERWGEGYGAEMATGLVTHAFDTLGVPKVIALVDPDHDASLRTARRAGLAPEKEVVMDGLPTVVLARYA